MNETKNIKSGVSPLTSIDLLDLPRYRLEGKFAGGGWWESNKTFASENEALNWYQRQNFATKSTHLKVVKAI